MDRKRTYTPRVTPIGGDPLRFAQVIHADQLVLEDEGEVYLLGFAEGAVHGLIITIPSDSEKAFDFSVELNDQSNSAEAGQVDSFSLTRQSLSIALSPEASLLAGRQEEADDFVGPSVFPEYPLAEIIVHFTATDEQWRDLRHQLARAAAFGCRVEAAEA